jgi:nucleoside-diphosphate-sugar epimerase
MVSCLITGATGFVGGHLAEACVQRGWSVRSLVRPGSDTSLLADLPITLVSGDLTEPERVREAVRGVDVVLHTAAKVGDWGPVEPYRAVNVEGLRGLLDACKRQSVRRFVHFSSLGVYAPRHHYGTDESEPLPARHMDGYTQSKVEAEQLALQYHREHGVPVVVLRPGFIYGPRDRALLPRLIRNLQQRKMRFLGSGRQALNCIYVGNLVEAAFLAVEKPAAVGQVYNLTDGEPVSKRRFFEALVTGVGTPPPLPVSAPLWLARLVVWWKESKARKRNAPRPPRLTQAGIKFLGLNLDFSIAKARQELGYRPVKGFDEAMAETTAWYRSHQAAEPALA